jgi:hypothetical protein
MAVDASKLKRRRSLGLPPTDGTPGIEETAPDLSESDIASAETSTPAFLKPEHQEHLVQPARLAAPEPPAGWQQGEGVHTVRPEPEVGSEGPPARRSGAPGHRQRVPPPEAEPRVPFTTRVTLSTKERLEDACYHLRQKHQDFINEAILAHLEKHGF